MLNLPGTHATDIRPAREADGRKLWAKDPSPADANNGTRLDATFVNDLLGLLRTLCDTYDVPLTEGSDTLIVQAVEAAIGATAPAAHTHDDRYYTEAEVDALLSPLVGGVTYQGTWNASTNAPALASGSGTKGHYYRVATAGSTALDGISEWAIGDWVIFNGAVWQKVDNTDAVASVAGLTGAISAAALKAALAIAAADISDASSDGRSLITAANYAAMRTLLGLATVAVSGAYADLTGTPSLGTAAALDVGTTANKVVQLDGTAKLPAVDGSQLTNLGGGPASGVSFSPAQGIAATNVQAAIEEVVTDLKNGASAAYDTFSEIETALAGKEPTQTAASQAEAEAGTEAAIRSFSPLRIAQAIAALAAAGGSTTIASGSLPAAATQDVTSIPATYAYLHISLKGASSNTASRMPLVQVSTNNGSSFDATGGNYVGLKADTSGLALASASAASLGSSVSSAASVTFDVDILLFGYQTAGWKPFLAVHRTSGGVTYLTLGVYRGSASAINAIRFLWEDTGNFDAGTYAIYGLN